MIIIPIKWLFHWEYTLFSDKPISCPLPCQLSPSSMPVTIQKTGESWLTLPGNLTEAMLHSGGGSKFDIVLPSGND